MTPSPGPPMLITATVRSHVHNGSAASRGDLVHRPAAHTSASELTNPLINPLMGNGIVDIERQQQSPGQCGEDPVNGQ